MQLPHRRFYTPATQYKSVPSEFHASGGRGGFGLHPIPSVIDLPGTGGVSVEVGGIGSGSQTYGYANNGGADLKNRNGAGNGHASSEASPKSDNGNGAAFDKESMGKEGVKHYDADGMSCYFLPGQQ